MTCDSCERLRDELADAKADLRSVLAALLRVPGGPPEELSLVLGHLDHADMQAATVLYAGWCEAQTREP